MGTRFDPNHPERPAEDGDPFVRAWRNAGEEAPWLLAWRDGKVMVNPDTGRYLYSHEVPGQHGDLKRGRGGRRA
jgi:hypothetical protein